MNEINTNNSLIINMHYLFNCKHVIMYHNVEGQKSVWAVLGPISSSSNDCSIKTVSRLTSEDTSRRSEKVLKWK